MCECSICKRSHRIAKIINCLPKRCKAFMEDIHETLLCVEDDLDWYKYKRKEQDNLVQSEKQKIIERLGEERELCKSWASNSFVSGINRAIEVIKATLK